MTIKDAAETWVRRGSLQAISVVAAVGLVIGGVLGLGVGYKIEQNRTRSDVKRLKAQIGGSAVGGVRQTVGALTQRVGRVTAVAPGTITMITKHGRAQVLQTSATALIEKTVKGHTTDIVVGRRVLVTVGGAEVIVLSSESSIGRVVKAVGSDSFSVPDPNGRTPMRVKFRVVKVVDTISTAKRSDIVIGSQIVAGGHASVGGAFTVTEVVLLPAGSGFAA